MWSKLVGLSVLFLASPVFAEETVKAEQSAPVRAPDTMGTLVSLGVGLLAVIAIIYGCAWIIRRMNGMTGMNNNAIKVVSVMALGARERLALIEVGGQQILLGITPSAIRTLHVFDEPVVDASNPPSGDFARRLQSMIGKSWTSPTRND
ncbi:flagellar biosynthetic protein FliO [Marinobacter sp. M216]|uniref:Flagellar protein n=1 Tax=Marinobacter albus TaxID=3030833 RepID=A0ABT7HBK0_9GAMM|nr:MULTISPECIES: flagellar biosynthetic protein FliO [unclassified Marinobacter]MBW7470361.1 flagellar biosynthetic protein FliO [Marinobacter sp. F4218]MDK9557374.1 flagellar biosynthetic protein FliO [Marinobacter sp. M216]